MVVERLRHPALAAGRRHPAPAMARWMIRRLARSAATPESGPRDHGHAPVAAMFIGAGTMHFVRPDLFEAVVPDWFPSPRFANVASGAAEIVLGALVLPRATRRPAIWALVALIVVVTPAHVDMARNHVQVVRRDGDFVRSTGSTDSTTRVVN